MESAKKLYNEDISSCKPDDVSCFFYMIIYFILAISFFSLSGCSERKAPGKYPVVDVANSVEIFHSAYFSDFFSAIELIALETNDDVLVGGAPNTLVNDSLIFVNSIIAIDRVPLPQNIHVFDHSGKFLYQIGAIGRGPGEFLGVIDCFLITRSQFFTLLTI